MNKVAERLYEQGHISDFDEIEKLRLAALLHDLGHYPFSHCLERPIQNGSPKKEGSHEKLSVDFINKTSIRDKFLNFKPVEISSIISKENYGTPLYSLLLSSDLDVDRMDYLIRDAHSTGVSYGFIDIDRLIGTLTVDDEKFLAIEDKGRQALEDFLLARYHMYQVVYYHKTVVGFELMLQRVYQELMCEGKAYDYDAICKLSESDLCDFNDNYVWSLFAQNKGDTTYIGELIKMLRERKRLKKIKDIEGISISGNEGAEYTRMKLIELPLQLEGLSKQAAVPPEWIFYSAPKPLLILSNPDDETAIRVLKEGSSVPIANDPASIIHSLYNSRFLYSRVYTKDDCEDKLLNGIKAWLGV
jgi:HD superfamily phosphohydrolase